MCGILRKTVFMYIHISTYEVLQKGEDQLSIEVLNMAWDGEIP